MKYGLQTYDSNGDTLFSTETGVSNVVLIGCVDITEPRGSFHIDGIPHGKDIFFIQTPTIMPDNPSGKSSPCVHFYPQYFADDSTKRIIGFGWSYWGFYDHPNPAAPDNISVRVYYGYY